MDNKTFPLNTSPPEAIAIYCSDPRFKDATESFIKQELKLPNWTPIIVPGSIGHLAFQMVKPKNFKVLKEQLETAAKKNPDVKRIILFNHEDCKWYDAISHELHHLFASANMVDVQKQDLRAVINIIHNILKQHHQIDIEVYYASILPDKKLVNFEKVI